MKTKQWKYKWTIKIMKQTMKNLMIKRFKTVILKQEIGGKWTIILMARGTR